MLKAPNKNIKSELFELEEIIKESNQPPCNEQGHLQLNGSFDSGRDDRIGEKTLLKSCV